ARGGQLHCVFGCGGNRDATKRPLMGQAAQRQADVVWVTSDNPRGEAPGAIVQHILDGMQAQDMHVQVDRTQAITQAIAQAAPRDVVLLAGKGHEDYQEIMGVKHPFLDMDKARAALALREGQNK
ncbi:MAG: cyanophycin synthetase, partial [Comamonadaceae bacterium]|nr:cyanophycin synthetase [Comamonadaceae bacterium]